MSSYAREERELVERDFEDDVRRAYHARSVDQLQDLRLSFATVAECLRRRAISDAEAPVSAPVAHDSTGKTQPSWRLRPGDRLVVPALSGTFTPDCERDDFGVIVDCDEKRRCVGPAAECAEEATCALYDARCSALWETQECDGRCARCGAGEKRREVGA